MQRVQQPNAVVMDSNVSLQQTESNVEEKQQIVPLIDCGVAQLMLSVILFFWSLLLYWIDNTIVMSYMAMLASLYHVIISLVVIIGGNDAHRLRCCVMSSMLLSIIGACIVLIIVVIPNFTVWVTCNHCQNNFAVVYAIYTEGWGPCEGKCKNVDGLYIGIGIISIVVGLIDVILSSIIFCSVYKCCSFYCVLQHSPSDSNVNTSYNHVSDNTSDYKRSPIHDAPIQVISHYPPIYKLA